MHLPKSLLISLAALTVAHHIIDLGYEIYQGHYNVSTSLIGFYDIRYAVAPKSKLIPLLCTVGLFRSYIPSDTPRLIPYMPRPTVHMWPLQSQLGLIHPHQV